MHTPSSKHCNVRALSYKVKSGYSVQRINNLTAPKRANIRCETFCIVQESGTHFFAIRLQT